MFFLFSFPLSFFLSFQFLLFNFVVAFGMYEQNDTRIHEDIAFFFFDILSRCAVVKRFANQRWLVCAVLICVSCCFQLIMPADIM